MNNTQSITSCRPASQRRTVHTARVRGFTLLELIIVVGVIALLAAMVLVAFRGIRVAGDRTNTLSALRQVTTGYMTYSSDHNQRLLPGYIHPDDLDNPGDPMFGITAQYDETVDLLPGDVGPYVWRLMPYLGGDWEILNADYRDAGVNSRISAEVGSEDIYGPATLNGIPPDMQIGLAYAPSIGLNSMFLGGDSAHGGQLASHAPWLNHPDGPLPQTITRMSEARNPGRVLTFAPSLMLDGSLVPDHPAVSEETSGSTEVRPPFIFDPGADAWEQQWQVTTDGLQITPLGNFSAGGGGPLDRADDGRLTYSRLDGSTTTAPFTEIAPIAGVSPSPAVIEEFMRVWNPKATGYR